MTSTVPVPAPSSGPEWVTGTGIATSFAVGGDAPVEVGPARTATEIRVDRGRPPRAPARPVASTPWTVPEPGTMS